MGWYTLDAAFYRISCIMKRVCTRYWIVISMITMTGNIKRIDSDCLCSRGRKSKKNKFCTFSSVSGKKMKKQLDSVSDDAPANLSSAAIVLEHKSWVRARTSPRTAKCAFALRRRSLPIWRFEWSYNFIFCVGKTLWSAFIHTHTRRGAICVGRKRKDFLY